MQKQSQRVATAVAESVVDVIVASRQIAVTMQSQEQTQN
jgi:hypothetical protein